MLKLFQLSIRDRPFNLLVFSDNMRVKILIFFQNLTLGYMTKTLNQIIFFFLHHIQNIFFSNIGNQNFFFRKKTYPPPPLPPSPPPPPPPPWKLNGPS